MSKSSVGREEQGQTRGSIARSLVRADGTTLSNSFIQAETWNEHVQPDQECYFDSCHLKECKTAAVITARREPSSFLLSVNRYPSTSRASLANDQKASSISLLPNRCRGFQLPALLPSTSREY